MNSDRLKQLFDFLKEEPNDPFLLYAIATEYNKFDKSKALEYYENLLKDHENYVGTYYHAAKLYLELGHKELAEQTFRKGIQVAQQENDRHALRELQQAYNEFLYDEEDEDF
jgi:tetratricopeptide (TPR) repeat protein